MNVLLVRATRIYEDRHLLREEVKIFDGQKKELASMMDMVKAELRDEQESLLQASRALESDAEKVKKLEVDLAKARKWEVDNDKLQYELTAVRRELEALAIMMTRLL